MEVILYDRIERQSRLHNKIMHYTPKIQHQKSIQVKSRVYLWIHPGQQRGTQRQRERESFRTRCQASSVRFEFYRIRFEFYWTRFEFYRIRTGFLDLGRQWNVRHQKYETKNKAFKNYLRYSFNGIKKISLCSRYRATDPVFWPKNRIWNPGSTYNTIYLEEWEGSDVTQEW